MKRFWGPNFDDSGPYLDRFGLLLALAILTIAGLSLVDFVDQPNDTLVALGAAVTVILVGATGLVATRASGIKRSRQRIVDIVVLLAVVGSLLTVFVGHPVEGTNYGSPLPITLLAICVPIVVIRRLTRHRAVTGSTIMGAIATYLLLPIAFFHVFLSIQNYMGTPFFGQHEGSTSFIYFSLTTITTTGYGDLTAQTNLGRLAAMAEAVTGQVYLVTFVAMLVGLAAQNWAAQRRREQDDDDR